MTNDRIDKNKAKEVILTYLQKNGRMRMLNELDIYKQDQGGVYAAWFQLKKDGKIKEENGYTYPVQE